MPSPADDYALTLLDVDKEYDFRPVLEGVTWTVRAGESYVLTAPNGSGKTTLLQLMAGLTRPTRGRVLWNGGPLQPRSRREIGVVLQQPLLYGDLTGLENLTLFASLYGVEPARAVAGDWLALMDLDWARDALVREYSKGMRQRLALARALLHVPRLLLLDEPFDGLDRQGAAILRELLDRHVRQGGSAFLVTHADGMEWLTPRTLTIRNGRLIATE